MNIPAIAVNNADVPDLIAALEQRWKDDATKLAASGGFVYDDLAPAQKVRVITMAWYRVSTRNYRRERAEREAAQGVTDPDVS